MKDYSYECFNCIRIQTLNAMAEKDNEIKSGPTRLKDTPRPEDLAASQSPIERLIAKLQ